MSTKRKNSEEEDDSTKRQRLQSETDESTEKDINLDLDSDEEDAEDTDAKDDSAYRLRAEDILGQEEGGPATDEGVQLTPFNMVEELEEGHFDKEGMYIFHKEKQVKDSWLENIDWAGIKKKDVKDYNESSDSDDEDRRTVCELYKEVLGYLLPGESINTALKRLGRSKSLSASERLKLKKSGELEKALKERNPAALTELTELGNLILKKCGNMDVYDESFDVITRKASAGLQPAMLDMFSDDFEDKEKSEIGNTSGKKPNDEEDGPSDIMWETKKSADSEEIEGPFTTEKMLSDSEAGNLPAGTLVRKVGTTQFYSAARIDFDLYQ